MHYEILDKKADILPLLKEEFLNLASITDIACMKFSAITGRASNKDYADLYYILQENDLKTLLLAAGFEL